MRVNSNFYSKLNNYYPCLFFTVELQVSNDIEILESWHNDDPDNIPDDVPLAQLYHLPPNTRFFFSDKNENITWKPSKTERDQEKNMFLGECNLPEDILELEDPYSLFKFFISDNFLSEIVEQTCLYSTQQRPNKPLKTDSKELEQFLGIMIWMSLIRQHSTRRYWCANTRTPQIADIMPISRFEELKRFLHFSDNSKTTESIDKIMPVLDQIKQVCQKVPFEEHLSCDEQIIPFKGRTSLKTYNPKKPHKWGYKMYVLSGVSGFSSNFELCSSKANVTLLPGEPNLGAASNIIVRLCRPIPRNLNHKVYYDNYFSSLYLLAYLEKLGIKSVATVRANRLKGLKGLTEKEMKAKGRGSHTEVTATVDGVDVHAVQWYDNRIVSLISTFSATDPLTKVKRFFKSENCKKDVDRPDIVSIYNMHMGGVDLQDSLLGLYPIKLKSRKWYMRIFCHMIDVVVVNAWLLSRRINKQLNKKESFSLLAFKTTLAQDLCLKGKILEKKRGRPSSNTPTNSSISLTPKRMCIEPRPTDNIRCDNTGHWPMHTENRERCKNRNCKGKSRTMCEKCRVHLCLYKENNCFKQFHCSL